MEKKAKVTKVPAKAAKVAKSPVKEAKAAKPTVKVAAKKEAKAVKVAARKEKAPAKVAVKKPVKEAVVKADFNSIVSELKEKAAGFDASSYQGFLAIQITLKDLSGVFYVEVKDGKLSIEPYEYYDRQANLIMNSSDFLKMINGKLNGTLAFTTGKLKIEGDIGKASELSKLFGK